MLIGAAVLVLDYCTPESVATFFGVDVLKDYEEFYPGIPIIVNVRSCVIKEML